MIAVEQGVADAGLDAVPVADVERHGDADGPGLGGGVLDAVALRGVAHDQSVSGVETAQHLQGGWQGGSGLWRAGQHDVQPLAERGVEEYVRGDLGVQVSDLVGRCLDGKEPSRSLLCRLTKPRTRWRIVLELPDGGAP